MKDRVTWMMWLWESPHKLEDSISKAVQYYKDKYGSVPTMAMVNSKWEEADVKAVAKILGEETGVTTVTTAAKVSPRMIWLTHAEKGKNK